MGKTMVQIGVMSFRDPATGAVLKPRVPIYAERLDEESKTPVGQKSLTDVSGIFAELFKMYADGVKKSIKIGRAKE